MSNRYIWLPAMAVAIIVSLISCKPNSLQDYAGNGISDAQWADNNEIDRKGGVISYMFTASGTWTADCDNEQMAKVMTKIGSAGESMLRLDVSENLLQSDRSAKITIKVAGYKGAAEFTIHQEAVGEQGPGRFRAVNEWVADYMKSHYLWNHAVSTLPLDYSLDYDDFLLSILDGVAAMDGLNKDDGYMSKDGHKYYTEIITTLSTKAVGDTDTGPGFYLLGATMFGNTAGIFVKAVVPGTSADKAGIKRGHFITSVNGVTVNSTNFSGLADKMYNESVELKVNDVTFSPDGTNPVIHPHAGTVVLNSTSYVVPSIFKKSVYVHENSGKRVGYLLMMGFSVDYDEELIAAFDYFKSQNITDLVLDFRFNNGGDVLSSTVLSTLIAGPEHKGDVYARLTFNEDRMAAGEHSEYLLGVKENMEYPQGYMPIETALSHSLNLDKIYMITAEYTASASEMVINGLRGVDIEVLTLGQKTNGKNVGMEGIQRTFSGFPFALFPVTFYIENAKGFKDYSDGFEPDAFVDDTTIYPGDFGTDDDQLCYAMFYWITTGRNPSFSASACGLSRSGQTFFDVEPAVKSRGGAVVIRNRDEFKK